MLGTWHPSNTLILPASAECEIKEMTFSPLACEAALVYLQAMWAVCWPHYVASASAEIHALSEKQTMRSRFFCYHLELAAGKGQSILMKHCVPALSIPPPFPTNCRSQLRSQAPHRLYLTEFLNNCQFKDSCGVLDSCLPSPVVTSFNPNLKTPLFLITPTPRSTTQIIM